jgi:hypothetical protein
LYIPGGDYTVDEAEILQLLLDTHFPGCILPNYNSSRIFTQANVDTNRLSDVVSYSRVEKAVMSFKPFKSAGSDEIFPKLLQSCLTILLKPLTALFRCSIALGHIPLAWQSVRVVFIPKAGRSSYDIPKSFRPISLTSFFLKTLERVIEDFLCSEILVNSPLHRNQHAYQKGKSTETALHNVVTCIEDAFRFNEVCLAVFLDVEGAFDNTSYAAVRSAASSHLIPEYLITWIERLLSDRILTSSLGSTVLQVSPVKGCPQGGVLSPLLWNLVADGLLRALDNAHFLTIGYADDYVILIKGKFVSTVYNVMQSALRIVENWCRTVGLSVNANKSSTVLFSRRRDTFTNHSLRLFGENIPQHHNVKYLGVILDYKLNWNAHVDYRLAKALRILFLCRRLISVNFGLKPKYVFWIYKSIVIPTLDYASLVWWPKILQRTAMTKINKLQRLACLMISGSFKTAPSKALEAIIGLPPIDLHIKKTAMSSAYRLNNTGFFISYVYYGHREILKLLFKEIPLSAAPSDCMPLSKSPLRNYELLTFTNWSYTWPILRPPDAFVFYIATHLNSDFYGAGIYCPNLELNHSISLDTFVTLQQSILYALISSIAICFEENFIDETIVFCFNNNTLSDNLGSTFIKTKLMLNCIEQLNKLGATNRVIVINLIDANNSDIPKSIILAKNIQNIIPSITIPFLPIAMTCFKDLLSEWIVTSFTRSWEAAGNNELCKALVRKPQMDNQKWILSLSGSQLRTLVNALTGHCGLNDHLFTIGLSNNRICRFCNADIESIFHILGWCQHFRIQRIFTFGMDALSIQDFRNFNLKDIFKFITICKLEL